MERLLILYLLTGKLELEAVSPKWVLNPLALKILTTLIKLNKNGREMTLEGLKLYFKETESKNEYLKLQAYLTVCSKVDTSITPNEVIDGLKTSYTLHQAESKITEISRSAMDRDVDTLKQHLNDLQTSVDEAQTVEAIMFGDDIDEKIASVPSKFKLLNETGNPLTALVIIGGATGIGKSSLVLNEVVSALESKIDVAFISLEMHAKLLENRLMSNMGNIPFEDLMKDSYVGKGHVKLSKEYEKVRQDIKNKLNSNSTYGKLYMYPSMFDPDKIVATIRTLAKRGVTLFVIDYLGLVAFDGWLGLKTFIILLNQLCMELGIVILLPTQVEVEKTSSGSLTYITKGSKEVMNSATLALLLYKTPESEEAGFIELHVVKSRNGRECVIGLENKLNIGQFNDAVLLKE